MRIKKGQSVLEYAVVIACVAAALIAMSVYLKRGMSGRLRSAADELGEQYAPKNTKGTARSDVSSNTWNIAHNVNEAQMQQECLDRKGSAAECKKTADINKNGKIEDDVFALRSESWLLDETTTQSSDETVGPLEKNLF